MSRTAINLRTLSASSTDYFHTIRATRINTIRTFSKFVPDTDFGNDRRIRNINHIRRRPHNRSIPLMHLAVPVMRRAKAHKPHSPKRQKPRRPWTGYPARTGRSEEEVTETEYEWCGNDYDGEWDGDGMVGGVDGHCPDS